MVFKNIVVLSQFAQNKINFQFGKLSFAVIKHYLIFKLQVTLTDTDQPLCTSSVNITINATDLSPKFVEKEYSKSIDEGSIVGTPIVKVIAFHIICG